MISTIAAALGLKEGAILSGFFGGLVSFMFFRQLPTRERIFSAIAGVPCGWYAGHGIGDLMRWGEPTILFITFISAALGVSLLAAVVKAAPAFVESARIRFLGGKADDGKGGDGNG